MPQSAAAQDASEVGVVSHIKVLSDKVEDVSSPEAWQKSYITENMSGQVSLKSAVGPGGSIVVAFSDNHGLDWTEVAKIDKSGQQQFDLKKHCYRRYDYRLRFQFNGKGTGLDALSIRHDVQHSQAPLPALLEGDNKITFSAGPQEGTVTLEGATSRYFTITDVPPGTKEARLRFNGHTVNTTMLFGLRIDADYRQPHGGFRPVKITYAWEEDGKPQRHEHVATSPKETYTIHCGPQTVVKSFTVELAN